MGDNDFYKSFDGQKHSNLKVFHIVLISFFTAFIGAFCAFCVFSNFNSNKANVTADIAVSNDDTNNLKIVNLSAVSLTNYSDTAVYAANKILPSIASITIEYEINYMGRIQNASGSGSGIVISSDGYILTNNHVISTSDSSYFYEVSDATSVVVTLYNDETEYSATIVGTDSKTDLAVLKIDKTDLIPAELGDSDSVLVGEFVLAAGDPYGLTRSVTAGIVSALNREMVVDGTTYNVIQADCAINSGNSGGALVNSSGQVIGITTLKLAGSGIEGVSFAIPINTAIPIYKELIENGKVVRPYIGISGIDLDEATAIRNGLVKGIYVDSVYDNSPAEDANIIAGDVIVKFNGKSVSSMDELNELKDSMNVGDSVQITLYRKNKEITKTIILGEN